MYRKLLARILALALSLALCVPALAEETIEAPVEAVEEAPESAEEVAVETDAADPAEAALPSAEVEAAPAEEAAEAVSDGAEEDPLAAAAGESPVETAEEAAAGEAPLSNEVTLPADVTPNYAGDRIYVYRATDNAEISNGQTVNIKVGVAVDFYCDAYDQYGDYTSDTGATWTTSNKNIATLKRTNGGKTMAIIGKKLGTATITVQPQHGGEKRTFKVKIIRNKLTVNSSAPMKKAAAGRCTIAIKNIEIVNRSKVVINFYLMNKYFRQTKYLKNLKINLKVNHVNGKTYNFVSRTISKLNISCAKNKSKVFKVTFTGKQVKKASFNLKKLTYIPGSGISCTVYGTR